MKIFRTSSLPNVREYQQYYNFPTVETCVNLRTLTFLRKYCVVSNILCITLAGNALHQLSVTQRVSDNVSLILFVCLLVYRASVNTDVHISN